MLASCTALACWAAIILMRITRVFAFLVNQVQIALHLHASTWPTSYPPTSESATEAGGAASCSRRRDRAPGSSSPRRDLPRAATSCAATTTLVQRVASLGNVTSRWTRSLEVDHSSILAAVVAGWLWKTRSVFQGVWEGAGGRVGAAAFHTPSDRRPG